MSLHLTQPVRLQSYSFERTRRLIRANNTRFLASCEGNGLAGELGPTLAALASPVRDRIAACPVALADAHFDDAELWACAPHRDPLPVAGGPCDNAQRRAMREIVLLAWHFAQSGDQPGMMLLGMCEQSRLAVQGAELGELEDIVARHCDSVRLRWADQSCFWKEMLRVAHLGDETAMDELFLQALRMLPCVAHGVFMSGMQRPRN